MKSISSGSRTCCLYSVCLVRCLPALMGWCKPSPVGSVCQVFPERTQTTVSPHSGKDGFSTPSCGTKWPTPQSMADQGDGSVVHLNHKWLLLNERLVAVYMFNQREWRRTLTLRVQLSYSTSSSYVNDGFGIYVCKMLNLVAEAEENPPPPECRDGLLRALLANMNALNVFPLN